MVWFNIFENNLPDEFPLSATVMSSLHYVLNHSGSCPNTTKINVCVCLSNRLASCPPVILLSTWTMEEQLPGPTCTLLHGRNDDVHSIQMN